MAILVKDIKSKTRKEVVKIIRLEKKLIKSFKEIRNICGYKNFELELIDRDNHDFNTNCLVLVDKKGVEILNLKLMVREKEGGKNGNIISRKN